MRQLSAEYFARSPLLVYPMIALGLFFVVFVVVSVRALRTRTSEIERLAALPLADSERQRHV
jgi:hypothetical protein